MFMLVVTQVALSTYFKRMVEIRAPARGKNWRGEARMAEDATLGHVQTGERASGELELFRCAKEIEFRSVLFLRT